MPNETVIKNYFSYISIKHIRLRLSTSKSVWPGLTTRFFLEFNIFWQIFSNVFNIFFSINQLRYFKIEIKMVHRFRQP